MIPSQPVMLIIFGGTGDLFRRKIAPSLYTLFENGTLPKSLCVVGTGRTAHTRESYREFVSSALRDLLQVEAPTEFLQRFEYVQGEVHDAAFYAALEQRVFEWETYCGNTQAQLIWYFSIAPELYNTISVHLGNETTLKSRPHNLVQVLVEKPLGYSGKSSEALSKTLLSVFDESQLFRIEHYLTKETLTHIPHYRSLHPDVEALLSRDSVASIVVSLHETIGVEKRGSFFDGVGALRDVGQNHLLEMIATLCMDLPDEISPAKVQQARIKFLEGLPVVQHQEITQHSRRLQYDTYSEIVGVAPGSKIETAFELRTRLTQKRWEGVQFVMSAGKRIGKKEKSIKCTMKPGVAHDGKELHHILFSIEPEQIEYVYTVSGAPESVIHEIRPGHVHKYQYVEEYARILNAAFARDTKYSVTEREVAALWKFTDQYLECWNEDLTPLHTYVPDTNPFIY